MNSGRRPLLFVSLLAFFAASVVGAQVADEDRPRPNILWLSSEDNGPHLGAYGDSYATTPNLDGLAARGLRYNNVWSTAPVCAPARTAIISGMYPTSTGSQHMRSRVRLPAGMRFFPQLLREAGYYTTNNAKEDYNLEKPGKVWDDSSQQAHWRNRPEGAPFFAVFNFGVSHESQIRRRPHTPVHDPAGVRVPAYHPDTPEVRRDWAQYYDKLTEMDAQVGERLRELDEAGLTESTIVFYWGDHGIGLPRGKRTPLETGLSVPLIVSIPQTFLELAAEGYRAGGASDRLVGFVDFAPTVLSLAGIEPPSHYQGRAFLGPFGAAENEFLFGFRDRMDERYDLVRSVRDARYLYARNYMPHRIYGEHVDYMFQTPTTQVWRRLFDQGRLPPEQAFFWREKPSEELYDLVADPDQVNNLAGSAEHADVVMGLRNRLRRHLLDVRDLGFSPEAEMLRMSADSTPHDYGKSDSYELERLLEVAELASDRSRDQPRDRSSLSGRLFDSEPAVRYWAATGFLVRGAEMVRGAQGSLRRALGDANPSVRVVVAEALGRYGVDALSQRATRVLVDLAKDSEADYFDRVAALNALDSLDQRLRGFKDEIEQMAAPPPMGRGEERYISQLQSRILADSAQPE